MATGGVNADLAKERERATFDSEQLTNFLYRGPEKVRRKRYLQNLAIQDPVFKKAPLWAFLNREQQYATALKKHLHAYRRIQELGITEPVEKFYYREAAAPHENSPIGLHESMFIPTIEKQATEEQKRKWLPLCHSLKMIGTYAQTELGHGTFIRGLETTATYDPVAKEFILSTPKLTAMKYWPGNLGKTTNHCLVMAQLITKGKNHGIHMFMLQTRDMETHQPLPGIELGDIGPKFGFFDNDNGYMILKDVRIPRENMFMRYYKVLEDGTYVTPPGDRLNYLSMVLLRSAITSMIGQHLSQACIIAIRYSAVRRQTEISPGGEEAQVLDYQTQQYKLFPALATSYAMLMAGRFMYDFYLKTTAQIEKGDLGTMPQLHALSAGLKAFSTWECTAAIEVCRMSCGGHGYSHASGIPKIYVDATPGCTYEGENTVMMLQVARFLMKMYTNLQKGQELPSFVQYMTKSLDTKSCMKEEVAPKCLVMAYEHRASRLIKAAADAIQAMVMSGSSPQEAWNKNTVPLTWAALAFCHMFVVKNFFEMVEDAKMDGQTKAAFMALCKLYAVNGVITHLGEFIQDGYLNNQQVQYIQKSLLDLLAEIRPNAVALVDAFDYPDAILQSCLGRYDGQVYQALYDFAKSSPLNEKEVLDSFFDYVKPVQQELEAMNQPMARL
ncbi:hypothetical protein FSP39_015398 [Pinctada imbricata]|uniref:Acyl-coenzyme A oxidase n=1 Tax=Pinctada imbricata TaxID=66713 RepID=A0AA88XMH0_PINIB|nr:hypothetical protein FSP39_015398 [Pinctada imbricata]